VDSAQVSSAPGSSRSLTAVTVTATLAVDVHWKRSLLQLESETQLEPMGQQRGWLCLLT